MKTIVRNPLAHLLTQLFPAENRWCRRTLILLAALSLAPNCLAQGSLTPPGPPGPTMKTLSELEPRTIISALPITITNPGSYYLTGSLTGMAGANGITIATNDVTIDLNGFSLKGVPGSITGILLAGHCTNLVVYHGTIRDWGGSGVSGFSLIHGGRFESLTVTTNASLGLAVGYDCIVRDCITTANQSYGIEANVGSLLVEDTSAYNGGDGIRGQYMMCRDCVCTFNRGAGIFAYNYSSVLHCHCVQNATDGIALGIGCKALQNTCAANATSGFSTSAGIRAFYGNGHIEANFVQFSSGLGIYVETNSIVLGTGWTVTRNRTSGPSGTAYIYPPGNDIGPIGTAATATSPWANLRN
jgi:hypothetical protein